jgi:phospholipid/cholesterol/gamma-HCH transport system substrate-binding protein
MKALRWRSVSGGIVALIALAVLVILVLKYARTGVLHGEKFRLYVAVPDATGLLEGSDVWLNGQRIGSVTGIEFAPPSTDKDVRLIIATDILASRREHIRFDSRAELRSGGTIIGAPVVYLSSGTPQARPVLPGDTLRGAGKSDIEIAASRATESLEELPAIAADAKVILSNARGAGARLSRILDGGAGRASFGDQRRALAARLAGNGSAGRLLNDRAIRLRVSRSMAASDSLRALLASRMNEMGRFRRDSTLSRTVRSLRDDIAELRALASADSGTVGRIRADSALRRGLDSAFVELNALMADIKKNPLRYARVF